jgi:uncharacterized membrane protein
MSLVLRAASLGFAAGLRSMVPLGVLARHYSDAPRSASWRRWIPFRWPAARTIIQVSTAGEAIVDKLPIVPPRINPGPLGGRIVVGAISGAAIGSEYRLGSGIALGVVLGGAGAVAGALAGYRARTYLTNTHHLPDLPVALGEDALAIAIASRAVR